jgi:uncharacterized membrane protein
VKRREELPLFLITSLASKLITVLCLGRIQKIPERKADKLKKRMNRHLKLNNLKTTEHRERSASFSLCSSCCTYSSPIFPIAKASGISLSLSLSTNTQRVVLFEYGKLKQ